MIRLFLYLEVMLTPQIMIFFIFLCLFTAFLSGVVGMAGGMILMGAMAWLLPIQTAMILHGSIQFVSNSYRAFLHRQNIMREVLGLYVLGLLSMLLFFEIISFTVSRPITFIVLGLLPILTWLPKRIFHVDILKKSHAVLCGMVVTTLQLTAGVSGSALDVFYMNKKLTRHQVVATKAVTQAMGHLTKIYYFGFAMTIESGYGISDIPPLFIIALIAMTFLGTRLSKPVLTRLSDHHFYHGTRILLSVIGVVYVWKGYSLLINS